MRIGERGVTLIEVLVATFLIGLALVPLLHLYPGTLGFNVTSEEETILSAATVRKMEELIGALRAVQVVSFDNSTGAISLSGSSSSATLTLGSTANYVLILVGLHDPSHYVTSVTVGGAAATQIAFGNNTLSGEEQRAELWGVLNPPTGSRTVAISFNTEGERTWVAASFANVSSATPLGGNAVNNNNNNASSTPSATLASRTANTLLVGGFAMDDGFGTVTQGTCQTLIRDSQDPSNVDLDSGTHMARESSGCSTGTGMNWTAGRSDGWVAIIVELAAGGSVPSSGTEACTDLPNCRLVWTIATELSDATAGTLKTLSVVACEDSNANSACDSGERQVQYDTKITSRL